MQKICIIGAGIAGLASAIYLSRAGFEVVICDRAPQPGNGGYAFLLLENGLSVLEDLGLMPAIEAQGDAISRVQLHDEGGIILSNSALQNAICIRRTRLCDILIRHLSLGQIVINHHFSHFIYDEQGFAKQACFSNGKKIAADFFIGADGTRSQIRSLIDPEFQMPAVRIRELVSALKMPPPMNNTLIKFQGSQGGLAAGYVPIGTDYVNWYIQFDSRFIERDALTDKRKLAQALIGHFPEPFATFIKDTNFNDSHLWDTSNMQSLPKFHEKNLLIIGDAAHTFSPFSSQGVNTALQDAQGLLQSLGHSDSLTTCLQHFSERRRPGLDSIMKAGHAMMDSFLLSDTKPFLPLAMEV